MVASQPAGHGKAPALPVRSAKGKTKAKQRYLKAKKERRKAKKAAMPKAPGEGKKKNKERQPSKKAEKMETNEEESDNSDGSDSDSSDSDSSDSDSSDNNESTAAEPASDTPLPDSIAADPLQSSAPPGEVAEKGVPAEPEQDDAEDPQYLFRFPRPQQTGASDAKLLASLGLPQGLARPTLVDAAHTQSLDADLSAQDTQDNRPTEHIGVTISRSIKRQLDRLGISEWFAVQASVIPLLLNRKTESELYMPYSPPRDLCVSAPTGSGKTLAYTVPIVELLQTRTIVQLRALVLVPTRDLAIQVAEMFDAVGKGSGLRSLVVTGNHSFKHEQAQLVSRGPHGYTSNVDVLIATPGRLVDHVQSTPGFTLQHLRFLVIDEADRLLGQSFQQWVAILLDALMPDASDQVALAPPVLQHEAPSWAHDDLEVPVPSVQKLLFSATLSRDPAKMNALQLRNPHYVSVQDQTEGAELDTDHYALPAGLHEHMMVTETSTKVLHLLYLLHGLPEPVRHALCFTKSVDAANRLVRLLSFFEERWALGDKPLCVQYYSSDLGAAERVQMLKRFQQGEIDLLVCSDLIARGIDLPEVRHVISYDVPIDMAKYVHRVGRTARAGRTGDAWSLVEEQEVYHFKRMLRQASHLDNVANEKVKPAEWERFVPCYKVCIQDSLYRTRSRSLLPFIASSISVVYSGSVIPARPSSSSSSYSFENCASLPHGGRGYLPKRFQLPLCA